jgi:ribose-phosphate pyrophosphokinase
MYNENTPFGKLGIVAMPGCESMAVKIDNLLKELHVQKDNGTRDSTLLNIKCHRFPTGESKGEVKDSVRGRDVYILVDVLNYGETFKMYGMDIPMSPDNHFQDLKRIIAAMNGKARRINVIMPHLYAGRQDCRRHRESLDCAIALKEIVGMGVSNIIAFDVHNPRVANAIPISGFENFRPYYQMIKALINANGGVNISKDNMVIVSPDEGGAERCVYYADQMELDLNICYKLRDHEIIIDGSNQIRRHEFLGKDLDGRDVILIDDIIASGSSVLKVSEILKERGAGRVYIFATFGQFTSGLAEFDKAYAAGHIERVFTTNLIYQNPELSRKEWHYSVDMSKYLASIIRTLNCDRTLSKLISPRDKIKDILAKHR